MGLRGTPWLRIVWWWSESDELRDGVLGDGLILWGVDVAVEVSCLAVAVVRCWSFVTFENIYYDMQFKWISYD